MNAQNQGEGPGLGLGGGGGVGPGSVGAWVGESVGDPFGIGGLSHVRRAEVTKGTNVQKRQTLCPYFW